MHTLFPKLSYYLFEVFLVEINGQTDTRHSKRIAFELLVLGLQLRDGIYFSLSDFIGGISFGNVVSSNGIKFIVVNPLIKGDDNATQACKHLPDTIRSI